jgi:hypothetical protein
MRRLPLSNSRGAALSTPPLGLLTVAVSASQRAGRIFWLKRKRLSGSYRRLIAASRA